MTREEYIKNLKNQGKVTVKDLAELLTFTLDKSNELVLMLFIKCARIETFFVAVEAACIAQRCWKNLKANLT